MTTTSNYAEYLKTVSKDELLEIWRGLCRAIRQEKAATGGRDLRSETASANCRTLEEQLKVVERVGKRRRIIG
jgi:hypothetical protein